jgi:hypothetical protein
MNETLTKSLLLQICVRIQTLDANSLYKHIKTDKSFRGGIEVYIVTVTAKPICDIH